MAGTARYLRFDTPGIAPRERFGYWRTWYSEAIEAPQRLAPLDTLPRDFHSAAEALKIGDVTLSEVRCGPAACEWRRADMEISDVLRVGTFYRSAGLSGEWHGRELRPSQDRPVFVGRTDGWWHAPAGMRAVQVAITRSALPVPAALIDRVTSRPPPAGLPVYSSVVYPLLMGMIGHIEDLSRTPTAGLDTVWISAITMLLRAADDASTDGTELAQARRIQARRYIDRNLADPTLSPDTVAAALHVSRRALYQLLSDHGDGIATVIRRQRLRRARAMLVDPAHAHRPIAEIAAEVGLPNAAHFSRLFRAEYGETPRDMRARGSG